MTQLIDPLTDENTQINDDMFREIYDHVHELQLKIFGARWGDNTTDVAVKYHLLMSVELSELVEETNFKVHKAPKQIDMEKLRNEAVDIVIYSLALSGCIFESFDEFATYMKNKVLYNDKRQDWDINKQKKSGH